MSGRQSNRNLVVVLGDQLNHDSAAFDDFDSSRDRVWMAETQEEATHVWCHQYRLVAFFSPMRHFRDELKEDGKDVLYHELPADKRVARNSSFASLLEGTLSEHSFQRLIWVQPGDARVRESLRGSANKLAIEFEEREDLSLIHISEPTRLWSGSRIPSSA